MQLSLVFTTALALLVATTSAATNPLARDNSQVFNPMGATGTNALHMPPFRDSHGQHRRLCVCWGPCCAKCLGWGCPKRLLRGEGDEEPVDRLHNGTVTATATTTTTAAKMAANLPLVWANAGPNNEPVQCKQRSWGLECPPIAN